MSGVLVEMAAGPAAPAAPQRIKAIALRNRSHHASSVFPASWVAAALAVVMIFGAMYFVRGEPPLTPDEHMLQNID